MDSCLAARSTVCSFQIGGRKLTAGCHIPPRSVLGGRRTALVLLAKAGLMPVPRRSTTAPGLPASSGGGRSCSRARDRSLPPSVPDIKLIAGSLPALRTCSLGQVGRGFQNLVVLKNLGRGRIQKNCVRSLALQMNPAGCPKDQAPRIRVFRKTRKGAPTSWVGTPRAVYLERKNVLAKGSS